MVNIPLFTTSFIHPRWLAGRLPSTVWGSHTSHLNEMFNPLWQVKVFSGGKLKKGRLVDVFFWSDFLVDVRVSQDKSTFPMRVGVWRIHKKSPSHDEWFTSRLGLLHEDDHYTGGTGGKCVRKKTSPVSDESRERHCWKLVTFTSVESWRCSPFLTFSPLNWRDGIASPDAKTSMSLVGSCSNFQKTHPIIHKS